MVVEIAGEVNGRALLVAGQRELRTPQCAFVRTGSAICQNRVFGRGKEQAVNLVGIPGPEPLEQLVRVRNLDPHRNFVLLAGVTRQCDGLGQPDFARSVIANDLGGMAIAGHTLFGHDRARTAHPLQRPMVGDDTASITLRGADQRSACSGQIAIEHQIDRMVADLAEIIIRAEMRAEGFDDCLRNQFGAHRVGMNSVVGVHMPVERRSIGHNDGVRGQCRQIGLEDIASQDRIIVMA